ncbi:MAG: hypothetical protein ACJ0DI_14405 [bacterium]
MRRGREMFQKYQDHLDQQFSDKKLISRVLMVPAEIDARVAVI